MLRNSKILQFTNFLLTNLLTTEPIVKMSFIARHSMKNTISENACNNYFVIR